MPAKQTKKKHGKGTVKASNGFASVAYEGYRNMVADSPIVNTRGDAAGHYVVVTIQRGRRGLAMAKEHVTFRFSAR